MVKTFETEDFGIKIGRLPKGSLNKISDVEGVKVGHSTVDTEENKTGVSILLPQGKNPFTNKVRAASHIINGFGKSTGIVQLDELGTIETPIALTNTLNIGLVHEAVVDYMIDECEIDNIELKSVNPIVCECNDSGLNNIRKRVVKKENVFEAIKNASKNFQEGDVGGGKGMTCHDLKGGIGSSSRILKIGKDEYTLGALVQANHGLIDDLTVNGKNIGKEIGKKIKNTKEKDEGSIITIIATDIPLSSRQLKRICKRAVVGLSRLGSYIGHGSGEVVIAFTTANKIVENEKENFLEIKILNEEKIDILFRAVAETVEESVLKALLNANSLKGYKGNLKESLRNFL
jgi:D-aminopeptidase